MSILWSFSAFLTRHLVITIPLMMLIGFAYGSLFDASALKATITPLTFLMVYPMMITLSIKQVLEGGDGKVQVATQLVNFVLIPFVAYAIGFFAFPDQPVMALGLLLVALVPTSGMTISYTGLCKGNRAAAVKLTIVGLTIGSLATPFYVKGLLGADIDTDIVMTLMSILYVVFLPMLAGHVTRILILRKMPPKEFAQLAPKLGPVSTIGVSAMVFVAMALKAETIISNPGQLLAILIPLTIFYAINYGASTLIGKMFFKRGDAIALLYGTVMRNLSIALAIAMNAFGAQGSDAALVIVMGIILQGISGSWYVKYNDQIFGAPPEPAGANQ